MHGDGSPQALEASGFAIGGVEVSVGESGRNSVDADSFRSHLTRESNREAIDGTLRGGVVDPFASGSGVSRTG